MTTKHSAGRPKRAGEAFARIHQHDDNAPDFSSSSKKPRFDVRNPSTLAPDAPEDDAVLDADVIGVGGAATKRGAVNLDGYDSDSENEGFDARAEERARAKGKKGGGGADLAEELDGYGKPSNGVLQNTGAGEDEDMFADLEEQQNKDGDEEENELQFSKKNRAVRFLDEGEIEGQVMNSKSGGHVSANFALDPKGKLSTHALDDQESSDDDEDAAAMAEEEGLDDEVGKGGFKKNAPKVDAFNMRAEQEEGRFDEAGNFVRKAKDPDAVHDTWLEGVSKKEMKKAAEAHEKREDDRRRKQAEDDAELLPDILRTLILGLHKGETVLEALARLGKDQSKTKKIPKWKTKKTTKSDTMDVDAETEGTSTSAEDIARAKNREAIETITGAADQLLSRGQNEVYDQEREMLIRQYQRETDEEWVEPPIEEETAKVLDPTRTSNKMWEYRWTDGRDGGAKQGPYDGATMLAWRDAGYFGEGVEFKRVDLEDREGWGRLAEFV